MNLKKNLNWPCGPSNDHPNAPTADAIREALSAFTIIILFVPPSCCKGGINFVVLLKISERCNHLPGAVQEGRSRGVAPNQVRLFPIPVLPRILGTKARLTLSPSLQFTFRRLWSAVKFSTVNAAIFPVSCDRLREKRCHVTLTTAAGHAGGWSPSGWRELPSVRHCEIGRSLGGREGWVAAPGDAVAVGSGGRGRGMAFGRRK